MQKNCEEASHFTTLHPVRNQLNFPSMTFCPFIIPSTFPPSSSTRSVFMCSLNVKQLYLKPFELPFSRFPRYQKDMLQMLNLINNNSISSKAYNDRCSYMFTNTWMTIKEWIYLILIVLWRIMIYSRSLMYRSKEQRHFGFT